MICVNYEYDVNYAAWNRNQRAKLLSWVSPADMHKPTQPQEICMCRAKPTTMKSFYCHP